MELHLRLYLHSNPYSFSKPIILPRCQSISTFFVPFLQGRWQKKHLTLVSELRPFSRRPAEADAEVEMMLEQPGGKIMVELVGAFNELTERMNSTVLSTCSSRLLFKALKLSIPILVFYTLSHPPPTAALLSGRPCLLLLFLPIFRWMLKLFLLEFWEKVFREVPYPYMKLGIVLALALLIYCTKACV